MGVKVHYLSQTSAFFHSSKNGIVHYYFLAIAAPAVGIAKLFGLLTVTICLKTWHKRNDSALLVWTHSNNHLE
ncbi:hypothetical protein [Nostoc sp.]|uniref:hypothetical protein n=1 Tax=Nostoc sp. TaxID=1180 RepID=UPI002FF87825